MKKETILFIGLLSLFISSCTCLVRKVIPKDIEDNIKYCYDSSSTGLDSIIPIHGYYKMNYFFDMWDNNKMENIQDTMEIKFMFYADGFFSWRDFRWGNYIIENDTIKTYYYSPPCGQSWGGAEKWFLINSDKSLKLVYSSSIKSETVEKINIKEYSNAKFQYSEIIPDKFDKWILEAKWFWCNETDWKNYMDEERKKRKSKKE